MDFSVIPIVAGLGFFIFVVEKIFSQAGKSNYAFIIDLLGFVLLLTILIPAIFKLLRTTIFYFPF